MGDSEISATLAASEREEEVNAARRSPGTCLFEAQSTSKAN